MRREATKCKVSLTRRERSGQGGCARGSRVDRRNWAHDRVYTACSRHVEMPTWIIILAPAPASSVAWAMPPSGCPHPFPAPLRDGAPGEGVSDGGDHVREAVTEKDAVFQAGLAGDHFRVAFSHPVWKELMHFGETEWEKVILQIFKSNFMKQWALIHLL